MGSYRRNFFHIIFATKNRKRTISENHCTDLYKYIWGTVKNKNSTLYRINGVQDHIHLLVELHSQLTISDFIKDIKSSSSKFLKESKNFPLWERWGSGYGCFTVSYKEKDQIIEYIKNQKVHHKNISFQSEFLLILQEQGIEIEERFLPG